jgi:hypothetical protein
VNPDHCMPRQTGLRISCPLTVCQSPLVRKVRKKGRIVTIQCKTCKHEWTELMDESVAHGLIVLAPPTPRR